MDHPLYVLHTTHMYIQHGVYWSLLYIHTTVTFLNPTITSTFSLSIFILLHHWGFMMFMEMYGNGWRTTLMDFQASKQAFFTMTFHLPALMAAITWCRVGPGYLLVTKLLVLLDLLSGGIFISTWAFDWHALYPAKLYQWGCAIVMSTSAEQEPLVRYIVQHIGMGITSTMAGNHWT